jgi:voltage-gated potassium channel
MRFSKLTVALFLFMMILVFGTFGYHIVEGMAFFEAFYMTIITVSTVGFSEIKQFSEAGRVITIIVIVTGIGAGTYTLGQLTKAFVEGELRAIFGRRKLEKNISRIKNHWIVCGFGRIGKIICDELAAEGIKFVVIELDTEKTKGLDDKYLYLNMDARDEDALEAAGIKTAKGIVTAVYSDADNVFITLTAKGLRPDIFVLSRASEQGNEGKLLRAGASRVMSPYQIGGSRMAQVLKRPTVMDFIDSAMMKSEFGLSLEEAVVGENSDLAGKTLLENNMRRDYGVIIVAIKRATSEMIFNPVPTDKLEAGDVIVVIGKDEELKRLGKVLQ